MKLISLTLVVFVLLLAPGVAEPLRLMHPLSLEGWNHGPKPISGWTVEDGKFCGTAGGVELLSGFSFDASELRMSWTVTDGGKLLVHLPEVPTGKGLTLVLCEGDGCGRLTDGENVLTTGVKLDPKPPEDATSAPKDAAPHTLLLRRAMGQIAVEIDGRSLYKSAFDTTRRFGLALTVTSGKATVAEIRADESLDKSLFNGKDLTGWREDLPNTWTVKNGELVLKPTSLKWLRSVEDYENFTLSLDYKLQKQGNSGIAIRTPRTGWPSTDGFEMQLIDRLDPTTIEKDSLMSCYCNVPPFARADKPGDEAWKHIVIKTDGWMVSAWVEGRLVQQFNTKFHPELRYTQLRGWIGFQDHKRGVRFRNLRLRTASDGEGLQAWYDHPEPNGSALLIDQLMNSEFLATDYKTRSAIVATNVAANVDGASSDVRVLADLTGPGAVTSLAFPKETQCRLSFYFDGQTEPRLTCKPSDLPKYLPRVNHTGSPLATILGYEKSLKIVARECSRIDAEARIEYVTMPNHLPVHSFVSTDETGIPRGWREPAEFRSLRIKQGSYHQSGACHTVRSPLKRIWPGKPEPLIHVDGAGTVKYVMLQGDRSILESDDLWIEVRFDRESSPAISAPARFWLPAFVKQDGFYNFVFRDCFGRANHLCIPFGDGVTISLVNHGKRSIRDVGLETSYVADETQPYGQPVAPMRLRGQYLPAGHASDVLFERTGQGRLVGLVVDAPKGATPGIARLEVDSQNVAGWSSPDMASLLGSWDKNFAGMTSGNRDGMAWRYFLLAPVDFQKSIKMQSTTKTLPGRLVLYYSSFLKTEN